MDTSSYDAKIQKSEEERAAIRDGTTRRSRRDGYNGIS